MLHGMQRKRQVWSIQDMKSRWLDALALTRSGKIDGQEVNAGAEGILNSLHMA